MSIFDEERQEIDAKEKRLLAGLLNENHRRVLATTLRRVEIAAWRLEDQLAKGEFPQLVLTRFTHPLNSAQRSALLQLTKQVREEVAKLASDYRLEVGEQDFTRTIMAEFTVLWCDLEDTRPQKLEAYGAINPQAYTILEPRIRRLIELVLTINDVASGKQNTISKQGNLK